MTMVLPNEGVQVEDLAEVLKEVVNQVFSALPEASASMGERLRARVAEGGFGEVAEEVLRRLADGLAAPR